MIYFFMNVLVSNPPKLSTPAPLSHYNSYTHNNTTLHLSIYLSPVRKARKEAQSYYREYREIKPVGQLVKSTASVMQEYTQSGGVRPFGVSLLVAGMDGDGVPRLFQVDPSGAYFGWKATAIGKVRRKSTEFASPPNCHNLMTHRSPAFVLSIGAPFLYKLTATRHSKNHCRIFSGICQCQQLSRKALPRRYGTRGCHSHRITHIA
jgi:hypothetical protein